MQSEVARPALDLSPGSVIHGFMVDLPLETVNGSRVYEAKSLSSLNKVVLKVVAWTEAERALEASGGSPIIEEGKQLPSHATEIRFLRWVRHENIVQLIDWFYFHDCEGAQWLGMVFQPHGILYIYVQIRRGRSIIVPDSWDLGKLCASPLWRRDYMSEDSTRTIFRQIVNAVKYLFSQAIIHQDLILENILVDKNLRIKLANFTSAVWKYPDSMSQVKAGTHDYWPPEMREDDQAVDGSIRPHNFAAAEVYAMGCLLLELVQPEGHRMYDFEYIPGDPEQLSMNALKILAAAGTPNERWSSEGWDRCRALILKCRHDNWRLRPTVDELMHDYWLFPEEDHVPGRL